MTGGFWSGPVPPWAYVIGVCLFLLALLTGMWVGYGRGWDECEKDRGEEEEWEIERPPELAPARFVQPTERTRVAVEYRPAPIPGLGTAIWARSPEVAHETWLAHEEQALAIANDRCGWCRDPYCDGTHKLELSNPQPPDLRPDLTDSQWMAYKLADLDQYMAGLLGAHPATEEL